MFEGGRYRRAPLILYYSIIKQVDAWGLFLLTYDESLTQKNNSTCTFSCIRKTHTKLGAFSKCTKAI